MITLKVSAGDKISIKVNSWYKQQADQNTGSPAASSSLATIAANLLNGGAAASVAEGQVAGTAAGSSINPLAAALTTLINSRETDNPDRPRKLKAYVNWILLDDHLKPIPADTNPNVLKRKEYQGFDQVGEAGELKTHVKNDWAIDKSGYVYIFTSNESEETNVLFDNLQVMQVQGNLIQVDHYYPFGLVMDGISGQGPGKLENKYKFGGKELQHQEFSDGSGLEEYDFGARYYDPQLGVWHNIDPLADINRRWSPYNYVYDNPLRFIDPDGMESRQIQDFNGNMQTITDDDDVINVYTAPPDKKDDDQKDGDDKSGDGSIDKGKEKVYRDPFYMPQPGEEDAVFKVRQKYNNINILKDKLENLIKELSLIAAEPAK